jgi:hypothetical protein
VDDLYGAFVCSWLLPWLFPPETGLLQDAVERLWIHVIAWMARNRDDSRPRWMFELPMAPCLMIEHPASLFYQFNHNGAPSGVEAHVLQPWEEAPQL